MPTFDITAPDGTHYEVTGPDGATEQQALQQVMAQHGKSAAQPAQQAAPEPSMMQRMATSVPVRMARGAFDPVIGAIQGAAHLGTDYLGGDPKDVQALDSQLQKGEQHYQADRTAVGQTGLDLPRIGGNILSPVNFMLPELAPFRGAGAIANVAARVGNGAVNGGILGSLQPVLDGGDYGTEKGTQAGLGALGGAAAPFIGPVVKAGGKVLRGLVGETTGAGGKSLSQAYAAGKAGGDQAQAFTDSMRGNVPWGQVVDDAKSALGQLRAQRGADYRNGMVDVAKDATVLDFAPIDKAMADASGVKTFAGRSGTGPVIDLSPKTADARSEVDAAISQWKALDPTEYHTPEGFDALKQQIGDIRDQHQIGTPQYKVASDAYNAIRGTIAKQAPAYNKVMQGYADASDEISSLERELSLGKKVNPNTALRKLQSVMRDNANTSWGERSNMAQRLSDAGAPNLLPSLAGQALSTAIPRGLAKYADAAAAVPAMMGNPLAALALPAASPRAMGELAYGAGNVARGATALGNLPIMRALPRLPVGSLGVSLPQLFANPAVNGAQ